MSVLIWLLRYITGFFGFFLLLMITAEVFGFIPHSEETPTFIDRLIACAPFLFFSLVLLVPHSLFNKGLRYKFLLLSNAILATAGTYYAIQDFNLNFSGKITWYIIVSALILSILPISNGLALWYRHKHPNVVT